MMKHEVFAAIAAALLVTASSFPEETNEQVNLLLGLSAYGNSGGDFGNFRSSGLNGDSTNDRNDGESDEEIESEKNMRIITIHRKTPIPVPRFVPYTVERRIPVPVKVPVKVVVPKPYPLYIPKPYAVNVAKPVPYPVFREIPYPVRYPMRMPVPQPYPVAYQKPIFFVNRRPGPPVPPLPVQRHPNLIPLMNNRLDRVMGSFEGPVNPENYLR